MLLYSLEKWKLIGCTTGFKQTLKVLPSSLFIHTGCRNVLVNHSNFI